MPAQPLSIDLSASLACCFPCGPPSGLFPTAGGRRAPSLSCQNAPLLSLTSPKLTSFCCQTGRYVSFVHPPQWGAWQGVGNDGLRLPLSQMTDSLSCCTPLPWICSTSAHQSNGPFIITSKRMAPECLFSDNVCPLGF